MGMMWIIAQARLVFVQPGQVSLMYLLGVMAGFGVAIAYRIPWSMIPDVIELDELRTGQGRVEELYAFMVFLQKIGLALSLFLVSLALDQAGFIETVPEQPSPVQPLSAFLVIRLVIGPFPTIALICGLVLAYFYPITRDVHAEILLKFKERKAREGQSN